jgi:hypothetical protein
MFVLNVRVFGDIQSAVSPSREKIEPLFPGS